MKKLSLSLLLLLAASVSMTNCTSNSSTQQQGQPETTAETMPYKLYPTQNMWTFIKLDTRNGKMWQVQYSVKGDDYRFETPLNLEALTTDSSMAGRFELHSTQNIHNFILLDGLEGNTWQVQWSTEPENQAIIPIHNF